MSMTSVIRYIEALDTTSTVGAGKNGLAFGDITAKYLVEGGTLVTLTPETITTLGTYQAPTSNAHVRIKEVNSADPTKGLYEIHFHNDQMAAAGKKLWLFLSASGAKFEKYELDLGARLDSIDSALLAIATYVDTEVAAIKAKTDNLPSDPADASDVAAAFSTVNSILATIAAYVDTEVAAIKAKTDNLPAAPAATGDIPTASQNAAAVLDVPAASHNTAGTIGANINDAASAADPLENLVPGDYEAGTAGEALGNIPGIKAKTDLIGSISLVLRSPVRDGKVYLTAGNDFFDADDLALEFPNTAGTWPDLTGATVGFKATKSFPAGVQTIEGEGEVVVPTGVGQLIIVELSSEQTDVTPAPNEREAYVYDLQVRLANGHEITLERGPCIVAKKLAEAPEL